MSVEINTVIIGGNLVRDVDVREIAGGRKVAAMSVASNRTYIQNGEKKQEVIFMDVDVWGPMADNCKKYLQKGSPVVVTGRLKQDQWKTDSGEKRSRIKVLASNVQFLSMPQSESSAATKEAESNFNNGDGGGWE